MLIETIINFQRASLRKKPKRQFAVYIHTANWRTESTGQFAAVRQTHRQTGELHRRCGFVRVHCVQFAVRFSSPFDLQIYACCGELESAQNARYGSWIPSRAPKYATFCQGAIADYARNRTETPYSAFWRVAGR